MLSNSKPLEARNTIEKKPFRRECAAIDLALHLVLNVKKSTKVCLAALPSGGSDLKQSSQARTSVEGDRKRSATCSFCEGGITVFTLAFADH